MSLDFSVVNLQDSKWNDTVASIPLQAHKCMMRIARLQGLLLTTRMAEYWEDTVFRNDELEQLQAEFRRIQASLSPLEPDTQLISGLLERLDGLITMAKEVGGHVQTIAD
jgi:hypothetical protein